MNRSTANKDPPSKALPIVEEARHIDDGTLATRSMPNSLVELKLTSQQCIERVSKCTTFQQNKPNIHWFRQSTN